MKNYQRSEPPERQYEFAKAQSDGFHPSNPRTANDVEEQKRRYDAMHQAAETLNAIDKRLKEHQGLPH